MAQQARDGVSMNTYTITVMELKETVYQFQAPNKKLARKLTQSVHLGETGTHDSGPTEENVLERTFYVFKERD
jgi:hypothetical protein